MDEKKNAILTIGILCGMLFIFAVADFVNADRDFSENENRVLASRPALSRDNLLFGNYMEAYEEYVEDQFISRDKWLAIRAGVDVFLQKKDMNGVYLGKEDYLFAQHMPKDYSEETENSKIASLNKVVKKWNAMVMLVPTADNVMTDKLPAYAVYYDQKALLEKVKEEIGEEHYIDVYSILREHKDEEIYYRTDEHWTSLGAYYGFLAWTDAMDRYPYRYSIDKMQTVSEIFYGKLYSKVDISVQADNIKKFSETEIRPLTVTYDLERTTNSLYEETCLNTLNPYDYFLDGNHGFVEITTSYNRDRTLFVIKDSYANSMIPLLTRYYGKIYMVDLDCYEGSLFDIMNECEPEQGMDVLVLYGSLSFLENFQYQ